MADTRSPGAKLSQRVSTDKRLLLRNSLIVLAGNMMAQLLALALLWLLAKRVTPSELGVLIGALGIALLINGFADLGINTWTLRQMAAGKGETELFFVTLSNKTFLMLIVALCWILLILSLQAFGVLRGSVALMGILIVVTDIAATLRIPSRSREDFVTVTISLLLERAFALGTMLLLIPVLQPSIGFVLASIAGCIVSILYLLHGSPIVLRSLPAPRLRDTFNLWKNSFSFGIAGLAGQLYRAEVAIVGAVAGSFSAGLYAVPSRIVGPIGILPTSFSTVLLPRIAKPGSDRDRKAQLKFGLAIVMPPSVCAICLLAIFAGPLIVRTLGSEYLGSVSVLRVYLIGMIPAIANQPISTFLQAVGEERSVAITMLVGSLLGLLLVGAGAYVRGAQGGAFGFLAMQVIFLLAFVALLRRTRTENSFAIT